MIELHSTPEASMPTFVTESTTARSPEETFDFVCDLSKWPLFRGYGPLPGIVEASLPAGEPVALGSRIRVRNTDGTVHHEVVIAFERGRRYAVRMELAPPASYVMRSIEESVDLEPISGGTRVVRRFATTPRSLLVSPVAWLFGGVLLRKAVEAHNSAVAAALGDAREH
jgi:hypothetical protein